jgi:hypothetical protein
MVQNTRFNLKPQEVPPKRSLLPKLSEANPAPEKGMNNAFPGSANDSAMFHGHPS